MVRLRHEVHNSSPLAEGLISFPVLGVLLVLFSLTCLFGPCLAVDASLTISIPAGVKECLHQTLVEGIQYEMEYQVIDGGEMDINFIVATPSNQIFITDMRKQGNVHKRTASESGDYRFCLDNSFSHFSKKLVYFELVTMDDGDDEDDKFFASLPDDSDYDVKLEDFKTAMDKIKDYLQKCVQTQKMFSAIESRDRSILEHNFERINFWSGLQLSIMVAASIVNVIVIRRLFADHGGGRSATKQRT